MAVGAFVGLSAAQSPDARPERSFEAPAGMILNYVQSGSTSDYERVMRRLAAALTQSEDAERRAQAAGWRVYRAEEPGLNGSVLYVSMVDPTVDEADYSVSQILNEAFPEEVQELYEAYIGAFVPGSGQILVNLEPVESFAAP
jgi:23S rRNA G2069 N7-methylase RlmK/C1962 C5-methylase RlmI